MILLPKLFTTLRGYSKKAFVSDLFAGIIVGIVAIPLGIAFGIASGVTPEKGLLTVVVGGFLISLLGGSRVQIGGPTGAFIVVVYSVVHQYGVSGLIVATILAGILLIAMGLAGFGSVIKFIPYPVIVGFTSGIAVIIFSSQIKDFLGLNVGSIPVEFLDKWELFLTHLNSFNFYALTISIATVAIIAYWPKISRKIPGSLIALILFSFLVEYFRLPVETVGSRFGELPHSLPVPHLPNFSFELIRNTIQPAFTIAILCGIESLLSAVVSDGMIGGRHRSNMELIGQGIANVFSGAFGGIPTTGALARTVTNIKNGGRTPVAGMVHALTVLIIVLFFGKWAKLIPLSCLAGILIVVAYNMSEWRSFAGILRGPRSGTAVLLVTFLLTVLIDLTVAIEVGVVLSTFIFMHRMSRISSVKLFENEIEEEAIDRRSARDKMKIPEGVEVYEINGPFFFGASHKFEEATRIVAKPPKVRILKLSNVPIMDSTGLQSFRELCKRSHHDKVKLLISGIQEQPLNALKKSGLYQSIGKDAFFSNVKEALRHAQEIIHLNVPHPS